jgi:hypothetical protein
MTSLHSHDQREYQGDLLPSLERVVEKICQQWQSGEEEQRKEPAAVTKQSDSGRSQASSTSPANLGAVQSEEK